MQYTKYFSFLVKENGQPQMSSEAIRTIMNIVYLEGVINGLNKSKEANKGTDLYYRFDLTIFREQKKIAKLTDNSNPIDFITKILSLENICD